ncbi:MAG: dihydroxyacetone kinase subunit L [Oscillospiraceae bacterium]|nr:dihydroxyacetone kinase subunit L [Oscillospiraceae bacterium]
MNADGLKAVFKIIGNTMTENKDYLTKLDQQNGDGDLGISMSNGFKAVNKYLSSTDETDIGKLLLKSSSEFNEAAPSSLGTILSFALLGMAQTLKGKKEVSLLEVTHAMQVGIDKIMERAGSKPGEKTVLDALCPAVDVLMEHVGQGAMTALNLAAQAAKTGAESTKDMRSVHGRAAYYGDNSIGVIDGGAVAGRLIFEALYTYVLDVV